MNKIQYDDIYFVLEKEGIFLKFNDYEEEEAYAKWLHSRRI